jgi:hypothetical protein
MLTMSSRTEQVRAATPRAGPLTMNDATSPYTLRRKVAEHMLVPVPGGPDSWRAVKSPMMQAFSGRNYGVVRCSREDVAPDAIQRGVLMLLGEFACLPRQLAMRELQAMIGRFGHVSPALRASE